MNRLKRFLILLFVALVAVLSSGITDAHADTPAHWDSSTGFGVTGTSVTPGAQAVVSKDGRAYTYAHIDHCHPSPPKLPHNVLVALKSMHDVTDDCNTQQAVALWQMSTPVPTGNVTATAVFTPDAKAKFGGSNKVIVLVCQGGCTGQAEGASSPLSVTAPVQEGSASVVVVVISTAPAMTRPGPRPWAYAHISLQSVDLVQVISD